MGSAARLSTPHTPGNNPLVLQKCISFSTGLTTISLALALALLPCLNALCLINTCSSWVNKHRTNATVNGYCAVMFDENCCKDSDDYYAVAKGEEGKLCGSSVVASLGLSSCEGPTGFRDDVESIVVMPGCTLEVWDSKDGLAEAKKEEAKGFNAGNYKDNEDRYDKNKLVFTAKGSPNMIEEL